MPPSNPDPDTAPQSILVLLAHPALARSRVNKALARAAAQIEHVTVRDLYESYPDFAIEVDEEQRLVGQHDVLVFQHPFFWYSAPALLKEWQDLVLEHGWAYGQHGHALDGKLFMSVVSTGAAAEAYCHEGNNRYTMRELLRPMTQTARLCRMIPLPPFVVHASYELDDAELEAHGEAYAALLSEISSGALDPAAVRHLPQINPKTRAARATV